ncbi:uncharacterized protein LOC142347857 isoform X4 [Convolutriloba macropyga]|uniref:uncharacterized protein LOC142347857 isoform X4 n=1 Tax=Convolutriloba macropyga TaxID=536237 RepID=UPI003F51FA61
MHNSTEPRAQSVPSKSMEILSADLPPSNQHNYNHFKASQNNFPGSKEKFNNASADNILINNHQDSLIPSTSTNLCFTNQYNQNYNPRSYKPIYNQNYNHTYHHRAPDDFLKPSRAQNFVNPPPDFHSNMNITQSPFRSQTLQTSRSLAASNNLILTPAHVVETAKIPDSGTKIWHRICLSLFMSIIAGVITVLLVYFVAEVKEFSTLAVLFLTLSMFLFVLFNIKSCKTILRSSFNFLASVQGSVAVLMLVLALLLIGPVDHFGKPPPLAEGANSKGSDMEESTTVKPKEQQQSHLLAQHQKQQQEFQETYKETMREFNIKLDQAVKDLEIENKFIGRDFTTFVEQCQFVADHVISVSSHFDQNSQCSANDNPGTNQQVANGKGSYSTPGDESKYSWSSDYSTSGGGVVGDSQMYDPIWRIIENGNKEIQNQQNAVANARTASEQKPDQNTCPCCTQIVSPFQKFCQYLSKQTSKFNISKHINSFKSIKLPPIDQKNSLFTKNSAYFDTYEVKNLPEQKLESQQSLSDGKNSNAIFQIATKLSAVIFTILAIALIVIHAATKPCFVEMSSNLKLDLSVALFVITSCLGLNALTSIALFGLKGKDSGRKEEPSRTESPHNSKSVEEFAFEVLVPLAISWLLTFIELSVITGKIITISTESRRNSAIRNDLTRTYSEDGKFNNNIPNALNFNITYPASPKLSKSLNVSNVCGKDSAATTPLAFNEDRCVTLPLSSSYV